MHHFVNRGGSEMVLYRATPDDIQSGVRVGDIEYTGYPEYSQLYPPFEHQVSIIDLLLHIGRDAPAYLLPV